MTEWNNLKENDDGEHESSDADCEKICTGNILISSS